MPYALGRRERVVGSSKRSGGVNGVILGPNAPKPGLSGEALVRDLPRGSGIAVDGLGKFHFGSVPRMESFRDESEAGVKDNDRDADELLDEEREPRDLHPGRR